MNEHIFFTADIRFKEGDEATCLFCAYDGHPEQSEYTEEQVFYYGLSYEEALKLPNLADFEILYMHTEDMA